MASDNRPTIQTVAKALGLSKATVSRALRGLPGQSEETRQRILEEAKRQGYTQHPLISALMSDLRFKKSSHYSPVIALIHCLPWGIKIHGNITIFKDAARKHAESLGYTIEEFFINDPDMSPKRLIGILKARGIRGAIFEHFWKSDVELDIDLSEFAAVAINFTLKKPDLHRVVSDQYGNVLLAIEQLQNRGYKRIGLSIPLMNESFTNFKREAALHVAHQQMKEEDRIPMHILRPKSSRESFEKWIRDHKPEVVLSIDPHTPKIIEEMGLEVPKDIGFVHLGWHPELDAFAGIDPNWELMAVTAANQVIDQMNRNEFGIPKKPIVTLISGDWTDGPSVSKKRNTKTKAKKAKSKQSDDDLEKVLEVRRQDPSKSRYF
ncbi:MAG: LacI family DNA-binding transcriptional regulator [Verrucomicrobiota bacterium]